MRQRLLRQGANELSYEIRGIVKKAEQLQIPRLQSLLGEYRRSNTKKSGVTQMDQRHHN